MHKAVDATFQANEDTEIGNRLDGAGNGVALGMGDAERLPWIRTTLLDAQGNAAALLINI